MLAAFVMSYALGFTAVRYWQRSKKPRRDRGFLFERILCPGVRIGMLSDHTQAIERGNVLYAIQAVQVASTGCTLFTSGETFTFRKTAEQVLILDETTQAVGIMTNDHRRALQNIYLEPTSDVNELIDFLKLPPQ